MVAVRETSKVTPFDIRSPPRKENNFMTNKVMGIIRQIRFIIVVQSLLGINRLYLFHCKEFIMWLGYCYNTCLIAITIYYMTVGTIAQSSYIVFKMISCGELVLLIAVSMFSQRRKLETFFCNLNSFDNMLKISKDLNLTTPVSRGIFWILLSVTYSVAEYVLLKIYIPDFINDSSTYIMYIALLTHDTEQIFYITLIRFILARVRILKGHTLKTFGTDKDIPLDDVGKVEALSKNANLDTTAMHRAYELLHECADKLNALMGLPMVVTLFSSGLSTTIILKLIFQIVQANVSSNIMNAMIVYGAVRCFKYTLLVIIPCYFSSVTAKQVSIIRTMLHNAINPLKHDKIERRKVKAFFQLTQDNNFTYALFGVIKLNMSLPLSYSSLCTTYLVIIIQFSKFLD